MKALSVVIPSYRRGQVALDSLTALLPLCVPGDELLLIDQTEEHPVEVEQAMRRLVDAGPVRWIRQQPPSIPAAMNRGLREARGARVLFLDDDIRPDPGLLAAHRGETDARCLVAGRVLQPWHHGEPDPETAPFRFNALVARPLREFMGGNFSLDRARAIAIGGFDEHFIRVAYRFEREFADRWQDGGGHIRYEPGALIHHLKVDAGGTRAYGDHLRTARPDHAVGAYYYLLVSRPRGWPSEFLQRPLQAIATRHHLRNPWWIPLTLVAELRGMVQALALARHGRKLLTGD